MPFVLDIKLASGAALFHLPKIAKIRNIFPQSDAEKLLRAYVTCGLDH